VIFTEQLADEYATHFRSIEIDLAKKVEVASLAAKLLFNQLHYQQVELVTGVPFYVVGIIHCLEADFNFHTHLHNGDPLTARTTHEPKGRPPTGSPPFTWEASAIDALNFDSLTSWKEWTVAGICYKLEGYNGWGYRNFHQTLTPYLWAGSQYYTKGKYEDDGVYNADLVSDQIGGAVILKFLADNHSIALKAYANV
jgi:lysozyme family protein